MAEDHVTPNPNNYVIGKGVLWVKPFGSGAYRNIGNVIDVTEETAVEKIEHYKSSSELRTKDKTTVIESNLTVSFTMEEITRDNLVYYMQGTKSGDKVFHLSGVTNEHTLKFVANNPVGPNFTTVYHRGAMSPAGAKSLIGEEWMGMPTQFEVLDDTTNNPTNPMGYTQFTTTTTTTTTAA